MPGVLSVTRRFLTTLSSYRPYPVSSCAALASTSAFSSMVLRISAMMRARCSSLRATNCGCAARAAATASSTVGKTPRPVCTGAAAEEGMNCGSGSAPPRMSAAMRRAISSMSRSVRRVVMSASLLVFLGVADGPAVDDGQDHGVDGAFVGDRGLPRGAAGGDEHDLVRAGADRVGGDECVAGLFPLFVQRADYQELDALDGIFFACRYDRADYTCQLHGGLSETGCKDDRMTVCTRPSGYYIPSSHHP